MNAAKVVPGDLVFAATARCKCGMGLAYRRGVGGHGSWECSSLILGTAPADGEHDEEKPFVFWNIKSDLQPSANGATTKPDGAK